MAKNELIEKIQNEYRNAKCELNFDSPFQLLVAVVLSAQCTDKRVNKVTEQLFKKYPTAYDIEKQDLETIENEIRSCGFYHNKALALKSLSQDIVSKYGGNFPKTKQELKTLRGVGEKTANVVVSMVYGEPAIAVDTHVFRVSNRLGLANANSPEKTQKQLEKLLPKKYWINTHYALVLHGRYVCLARNPKCEICDFKEECKFYQNMKKSKIKEKKNVC